MLVKMMLMMIQCFEKFKETQFRMQQQMFEITVNKAAYEISKKNVGEIFNK